MPIVRIEFDDRVVEKSEMEALCQASQNIVREVTEIKEVFVYGNCAPVKVGITPVEIFVELSAHKVKDIDEMISQAKIKIADWKKETNFPHLISITITPMHRRFEVDI